MKTRWASIVRVGIPFLIVLGMLPVLILAHHSLSPEPIIPNETTATVLAAYQAWHGLPSHHTPPPYSSADPQVISRHIQTAKSQGIQGFVVDWYGPSADLPNQVDREFIDQVTTELIRQSAGQSFKIAIMYDEGTIATSGLPTTSYTTQAISDLQYATRYLTNSAYLTMNQKPAIFVFTYDSVEPHIRWADVRAQLGLNVVLLDKDPNPDDPERDAQYDGHYAWVQPTYPAGWKPDGSEWGEGYLQWFYATMTSPTYTSKIAVGSVWPGFDDTLAAWGSGRYIARRCGQTWRDTWRLANDHNPPFVLIATWNDSEEGTDIEHGIGLCLGPANPKSILPGAMATYSHTLANTGKFTETFMIEAHSAHGWLAVADPKTILVPGNAAREITISVSAPAQAPVGMQDSLMVTAASVHNPTTQTTVVNTTTVLHGSYLSLVRR
jgi:hypothetical protein